jgi:chromosome partitioning protein
MELGDDQLSAYDLLTDSAPVEQVAVSVCENVTIVPADIDLAGAEAELISVTGREVLLREALEPVADSYDYLLIDCPPSLGVLTVNALVAAREVLIPLQAHFLALQGLSRLLDTVTLVRQRINPNLKVNGIVLCLHDASTRLASEVVDDLVGFLDAARGTNVPWADARVYGTCIRRNIKLAESSSFGQTVFDYAPRSHGAIDHAKLAAELSGDDVMTPAAETDSAPTRIVPAAAPSAGPYAHQDRPPEQDPSSAGAAVALQELGPTRWPADDNRIEADRADTITSTP